MPVAVVSPLADPLQFEVGALVGPAGHPLWAPKVMKPVVMERTCWNHPQGIKGGNIPQIPGPYLVAFFLQDPSSEVYEEMMFWSVIDRQPVQTLQVRAHIVDKSLQSSRWIPSRVCLDALLNLNQSSQTLLVIKQFHPQGRPHARQKKVCKIREAIRSSTMHPKMPVSIAAESCRRELVDASMMPTSPLLASIPLEQRFSDPCNAHFHSGAHGATDAPGISMEQVPKQ